MSRRSRSRGASRPRPQWAWPCSPATRRCGRPRMLVALGLALALMAGEGWDELARFATPRRPSPLRLPPPRWRSPPPRDPAALAVAAAVAGGRRRCPPSPDRCRGRRGRQPAVPLYVVLGGGALAEGIAALRSEEASPARCPRPLALALLAAVGLYAVRPPTPTTSASPPATQASS